jgi:hypothetical protein
MHSNESDAYFDQQKQEFIAKSIQAGVDANAITNLVNGQGVADTNMT